MCKSTLFRKILICAFVMLLFGLPLHGKPDRSTPKEFGTYIKTSTGLKRLTPNIVFDQNGVLFIESNNPARYTLKDVEYFVIYGPHNMDVLTVNPLLFLQASPLGKPRYAFGKNIEFTVQSKGNNLFTIKPKGLMGRGYYCLWIEDTAWDFIIE